MFLLWQLHPLFAPSSSTLVKLFSPCHSTLFKALNLCFFYIRNALFSFVSSYLSFLLFNSFFSRSVLTLNVSSTSCFCTFPLLFCVYNAYMTLSLSNAVPLAVLTIISPFHSSSHQGKAGLTVTTITHVTADSPLLLLESQNPPWL